MSTPSQLGRAAAHPVDRMFHERWSSRAFTDEPIAVEELLTLLEAARWAPSAMNAQPWRFVYGLRGTPAFDRLLSVLVPSNQAWAGRAAALVALVSRKVMDLPGKDQPVPSSSHSFDAGAAWATLGLQAHLRGWVTHAMGGIDRERGTALLEIPPDHQLEVIIAVGRRGDPATLTEAQRAREKPSDRRPIAELVREGLFRFGG